MVAAMQSEWLLLVTVAVAVFTKAIAKIRIYEPQTEEFTVNEDRLRLKLKCTSEGSPIDWYRDDVELMENTRMSITKTTGGNIAYTMLTVRDISVRDSGVYTCKNPNNATQQDSVKIIVTPSAIRAFTTAIATTSTTIFSSSQKTMTIPSTTTKSPKVVYDVETAQGAASTPDRLFSRYAFLLMTISYVLL